MITDLTPLESKIVQFIQDTGHITAQQAQIYLDTTSASLAKRICDLRNRGYKIVRERAINSSTGKRYTRYKFGKAKLASAA